MKYYITKTKGYIKGGTDMKRNYPKKVLAVALSCAMVFSSVTICDTTAKADLTTEQMVVDASYNLALGKTITANPTRQEGSESALTDGKFDGEHAATTFGTAGTYYLIDLGQAYEASGIDKIVVNYKEFSDGDVPTKGYKIQYSADGVNYTDVKSVTATDVTSQITADNLTEIEDVSDATGVVRYIKLLYPDSYTWGIQAREIAVLDTNQDAQTAVVEKCDEAAGVTVTSTAYNSITYSIIAGANQESYVYMVYLDGKTNIGNAVQAGTDYTVTGIDGGYHTLKVVAVDNGKISDGITSDSVIVSDISELVTSTSNVANRNNNPSASIYSASAFYDGHSIATAQVALDGKITSGEGTDVALRTAAGSPQSFVVDLGKYYTASEFDQVVLGYSNPRTYAANTKVEFSRNGSDYTVVGESSGYTCQKNNAGTADINAFKLNKIDAYTDEAVRFVKITLSDGASGWGYVVNEFGITVNTDNPTIITPNITEAADFAIETYGLERIKYTITAGEGQEGYSYIVKAGGEIINENAQAGVEYVYEGLAAGTYEVNVAASHDGWITTGISKTIVVDGYVNYISSSLNLALRSAHPEVTVDCDNNNRLEETPETGAVNGSQGIGAVIGAINNGVYTDHSHHTGYLQTRPDRDEATIDYDLGTAYIPSDIHSVIALYESTGNAATEYEILLSGDGENFEQVLYVKDAKFDTFSGNAMLNDVIDTSQYTQDTVRYIKYHIINGNYMRHSENEDGTPAEYGCSGYHLCELAVMGKDNLIPEKVTNVEATSPEYNKLVVNWTDVGDTSYTYNIYMNGNVVARDVPSGTQTKEFTVRAGNYIIIVAAVSNGIENKSDEVTVVVEEETTTPTPTTKPTTTQPITTQAPPTQAPTTKAPTTQAPTIKGEENTTPKPVVTTSTDKQKTVGKTKILKIKIGKKKVSLTLKKVKGAKGYRVKYSTSKKLKNAKMKTSKKNKVTIKKLKKGKVYYFKVQAFTKVNGKKVYGKWSAKKRSKKIK